MRRLTKFLQDTRKLASELKKTSIEIFIVVSVLIAISKIIMWELR